MCLWDTSSSWVVLKLLCWQCSSSSLFPFHLNPKAALSLLLIGFAQAAEETRISVATFFFYISTLSSARPGLQQRDVTHSALNAAWHRAGWLSLSLVPQTSSGIRLWLCLSGVAVVIWWLSRAIRADLCTPSYIQKTAFFCVVFFFCAHFVVRNLVGIKKEHRFEARCVYAICMRGHGKKTYTY